MKLLIDSLCLVLLVVLGLAILVAGYYLGIIFAILSAVVLGLAIVFGVLFLVVFFLYDQWQTHKERRASKHH